MAAIRNNVYMSENMLLHLLFLASTFSVLSATLRKCPRPLPPPNAKITGLTAYRKYEGRSKPGFHGVEEYHEYDEVSFTCNEGYIRTGILPYFNKMYTTCGSNGKWFPKTSNLGHCVLAKLIAIDNCIVTENLFKCKSTGKCITKEKLCDCKIDCQDGSDEMNCTVRRRVIFATPTPSLRSTGIITSPGYPRKNRYPDKYNCIYHIYTLQDHHIQIDFEDFDLPKKQNNKCVDFVKVSSIHPDFIIQKRKKHGRKKYRTNRIRNSQTKCAGNKFQRIYSNASHITINVSLGYIKMKNRHHKGFSLSWQVQSKNNFNYALRKLFEQKKQDAATVQQEGGNKNNSDSDTDSDNTIYTLVLPIALGGLLPMTLLLLYLCHRIIRHHFQTKHNNQAEADSALTMTLTENNLARFEEQNCCITQQQEEREDNSVGLLATTNLDDRFVSQAEGNSNGSTDNETQPPNCHATLINNNNKNKTKTRESTELSQHSNLPRYIMSYDMPLRYSPSNCTRQSSNNNSSHHISSTYSQSRSNSPHRSNNTYSEINSSSCSNNQISSQHHQHHQEHHQKQHHIRLSNNCTSPRKTTCSLCHKKRSACNSERQQRIYLQQQQQQQAHIPISHPPSVNTDQLAYPLNFEHDNRQLQQQKPYKSSLNSVTYLQNTYTDCDSDLDLSNEDLYNSIDNYPFIPSQYISNETIPYSRNTVPYPLNYSDSDFIADSALRQPVHRVEKHKVIYLEERSTEEVYGSYADRTRGGGLICTH